MPCQNPPHQTSIGLVDVTVGEVIVGETVCVGGVEGIVMLLYSTIESEIDSNVGHQTGLIVSTPSYGATCPSAKR